MDVTVALFPPFERSVCVQRVSTVRDVWESLAQRLPAAAAGEASSARLCLRGNSLPLLLSTPLSALPHTDFCIRHTLRGGKGGFGSQLRAAGGRMSKRRNGEEENTDACRDLEGRRLGAVKRARELAEWLKVAPGLERREREEKRAKLQRIIDQAQQSSSGNSSAEKFDDQGFFDECEELRDQLRDSVKDAMRTSLSNVKSDSSSSEEEATSTSAVLPVGHHPGPSSIRKRRLGFDDDDDDDDDDDNNDDDNNEDNEDDHENARSNSKGKEPVKSSPVSTIAPQITV